MNECFLLGTIINKVNFRFAIGGKHDSIIEFELKLENESVIMVKAYDKLADYCYQNITENNLVMIRGKLDAFGYLLLREKALPDSHQRQRRLMDRVTRPM